MIHKLNETIHTLLVNQSQGITISDKLVKDINDNFTQHVQHIAAESFKKTKIRPQKNKNNNPWFNWQARIAKRETRKAANATSQFPSSDFLRENFYKVKKSYKKLLNKSKLKYFENLNKDIEDGKVLNWESFKKLKSQKSEKLQFDTMDMENFESFFRDLYSDNHTTIDTDNKNEYIKKADEINDNSLHPVNLNVHFSKAEVTSAVKSLKSGKSSGIDMISNEIIKCFNDDYLQLLTNLFNLSFDSKIYPWNESIITLLHKKGKKSDPDNYRAIAISSVIGKLFSSILLERLVKFRKENCPDPPNQLGFTKGAQTYDHILTMQTIISKYKKIRKPVYTVFVDFKKAFDSVCRQALFFKIAKMGITGKFYSILRNMYSNSSAYIKLSGHLSNKLTISKGTEQGHPLSPDLFKIFLFDLSKILDLNDCPELSNTQISHLLWADDLIMLSLSPKTCQTQLDILGKFCTDWGIEINEIKTQVMICGNSVAKNLNFKLLGNDLEIVDTYCYLGIIIHKSGELRTALLNLKTKAMRAFLGLKRNVIRSKLSFRALTTLFDSLIKPIALYGAPIWTPTIAINKSIIKYCSKTQLDVRNFISKINRSMPEKIHLSFLKWALGVHRKASNVGVWGETGRYPLIYQSIRLTLNYYKRLTKIPKTSFVFSALKEQKSLKLPWFKNIEPLLKLDEIFELDHVSAYRIIQSNKGKSNRNINITVNNQPENIDKNPVILATVKPLPSKKFRVQRIIDIISEHFVNCWEYEKSISPKLTFYNYCKHKFGRETYLDTTKGFSRRYNTTKIRISAHDLEIESGRYNKTSREMRICNWCKISMRTDVIEDENHLLFECDLYSNLRSKLISRLNNTPKIDSTNIFDTNYTLEIDHQKFRNNLMKLLSHHFTPNLAENEIDPFNYHHKMLFNKNLKVITPEMESLLHYRSYIINCVCTYICKAYEKRQKYASEIREISTRKNTIIFNFI